MNKDFKKSVVVKCKLFIARKRSSLSFSLEHMSGDKCLNEGKEIQLIANKNERRSGVGSKKNNCIAYG